MKEVEPSIFNNKMELASLVKGCRDVRHSIKSRRFSSLNDPFPDLHGTVPAKAICDELIHLTCLRLN